MHDWSRIVENEAAKIVADAGGLMRDISRKKVESEGGVES